MINLLYQGNTLSLSIATVSLANFLTACKMTSHLSLTLRLKKPDTCKLDRTLGTVLFIFLVFQFFVFLVIRSSGFLFIQSSGFGLMDQLNHRRWLKRSLLITGDNIKKILIIYYIHPHLPI